MKRDMHICELRYNIFVIKKDCLPTILTSLRYYKKHLYIYERDLCMYETRKETYTCMKRDI